ncbi:MAG: N-acetylmuramoyl-L-alanine amidase [Lachnospiraceae bacterium]|nr:N-acetylmuramoyl-L-alanine amidase [Lachnospiraceae bacterium]
MIFNIHAGHNPTGKTACGAVSILNESKEDRIVKNEVIRQLQLMGHTVYDCTVDDGANASDVLRRIVAKCNAHRVDLDVSIHFNAGAGDTAGNGRSTGTEVFIYDSKSTVAKQYALNIVNAIERLGFKNRGVKTNPSLYVLKNTKAQALLIECCFVDDADDARLYDARAMADAIVFGLTGKKYEEPKITTVGGDGAETNTGQPDAIYRVQVGAYRNKANAQALQEKLKAAGFDSFVTRA